MTSSELSKSMTEWTVRLQTLGPQCAEAAERIADDKVANMRRLEELERTLRLPCYRRHITDVGAFLQAPETHLQVLDLPWYFAILSPKDSRMLRLRGRYPASDVEKFVRNSLDETDFGKYYLILEEFSQHLSGGTILCDPDGSVYAEMIGGEMGLNQLLGGATPEYTMRRDPITGLFSYSSEDPSVREAIFRAVMRLCTSRSHLRDATFHTGYFEFNLTPNGPVFIEYSPDPIYRYTCYASPNKN